MIQQYRYAEGNSVVKHVWCECATFAVTPIAKLLAVYFVLSHYSRWQPKMWLQTRIPYSVALNIIM